MKIFVEKILISNRAPFENLDLTFKENEIAVLTAINGQGKTTILSHIVDAWHEMIRPHFPNEFEGKENEYYRVSSSIFNINQNKPSFVYIRFKSEEGYIDYIDVRNNCTQQQYDDSIKLKDKIPFSEINRLLEKNSNIKLVSKVFDKKKADVIFQNNVITYFPAYRYEVPAYLNEPYKIHLDFTKEMSYSGYLPNPLEVVTGLPQLANWIMDIVLDMELYKQMQSIPLPDGGARTIDISVEKNVLWDNLNQIISQTLISKKYKGTLRFGIGRRDSGITRISIMNEETPDGKTPKIFYPTIFYLSSGEAAMFCMFGEILRQADKIKKGSLQQITGIVLIDEIDKHLHIKLQKEILPQLFTLFPNIQFIVSSHSPFLNIGLAEKSKERAQIIDLDNMGISIDPTTNELYTEVYEMMINENNRFVEKYNALQETIKKATKPLIITEGKTDVKHLKKAQEKLGIDVDVDYFDVPNDWGDSQLKDILEKLSLMKQPRKIIGIFDRDTDGDKKNDYVKYIGSESYKKYGDSNVYAFVIPLPEQKIYGKKISIEHYYSKENLLKTNAEGRRLFLGEEFYNSSNSKDGNYQTKISNIQHKVDVNGLIDGKVYQKDDLEQKTNVAMTKDDFAILISDDSFSRDFDFSNFSLIFDKVKEIIKDAPN